jgi:hypothetical protein
MTATLRKTIFATAAVCAFIGALLWNGTADFERGLVSSSEARVGRPLTPMSYAGVARRTTRRAVVATGAAAAAGAAYYAAPGCVQVTNAYGQIVTQC